MVGKLKVVSPAAYRDFLLKKEDASKTALTPIESGKQAFSENLCTQCHSVDGKKGIGPSLGGVFTENERKMVDGTSVAVDENYIRESIIEPQKHIVEGYPPVMQSYQGRLSEKDIANIIDYLKSLETEPKEAAKQQKGN